MVKEEEKRYIVSLGEYKSEKLALERRKAALDAGLSCKIIDLEDKELPNIYASILLVAEQVKALTDGLTKMADSNTELLQTLKSLPAAENKNTDPPKKTNTDLCIARLIKEKRKARGYTQRDVADILGIEFGTISKYETGRNPIPEKRLAAISKLLKITKAELDNCGENASC